MDYHFNDFTEVNYRRLIQLAKRSWKFVDFPSFQTGSKICLWRHDIDFSVQRAHSLAKIEADEGVKATYFIDLHSNFYNALENESIHLLHEIVGFGHFLGLHFDGTVYPYEDLNKNLLTKRIKYEAKILETFFEVPINCFSFHNPHVWNALKYDNDTIGGLTNAYGKTIKKNFVYVSDSNGYWRYLRLFDVLENAEAERLHVLTHDAWWQKTAMSPNERVQHCINNRAENTWKNYSKLLQDSGREMLD